MKNQSGIVLSTYMMTPTLDPFFSNLTSPKKQTVEFRELISHVNMRQNTLREATHQKI